LIKSYRRLDFFDFFENGMPPEERAASESSIESDEETDKEDDALDKY